jgi:hypothetical protein
MTALRGDRDRDWLAGAKRVAPVLEPVCRRHRRRLSPPEMCSESSASCRSATPVREPGLPHMKGEGMNQSAMHLNAALQRF